MKLTRTQRKKLNKKLRTNASAEHIFVNLFLGDIKRIIGERIKKANSFEEVDKIINGINIKRLRGYIRGLKNSVLSKNNTGFAGVIQALTSGAEQLRKTREQEKKFAIAVPKLIKEKKIYNPLMQIFERNMSKIKDLPKEVYNALKKGYAEGKGFRGSEVEKELYKRLGNRAKLIVRTESSKVNAALTEVRARSVGVKAYVWSTSGDRRVRGTHDLLDGVLVFWNDKPELNGRDVHAGEDINCRCTSLPIFDIQDIKFPIKVAERFKAESKYIKKSGGKYKVSITGGSIRQYTKQQFLTTYGDIFVSHSTTPYTKEVKIEPTEQTKNLIKQRRKPI